MPTQTPNGSDDGLATTVPTQESDLMSVVPATPQRLTPRSRLEERVIDEGDPRILEASLDGWTQDLHKPRISR